MNHDLQTIYLAEIKRLRDALTPFADHAADWEAIGRGPDDELVEPWPEGPDELPLRVGHLIAARTVLDNSLIPE